MKIEDALDGAADLLSGAGIVSAKAEAEILLSHCLGISRGELITKLVLGEAVVVPDSFEDLLSKRQSRIPLQHLIGTAPFRNIELNVGPGVFIPRPETEQVAQVAIDFLSLLPGAPRALDIGTGSGAIAISLAKETNARVTAIELSEDAAIYASRNIEALDAHVKLLIGDFMELVGDLGEFDLVISNPPYIPEQMTPIDVEVREHDPELALYGGSDGLDVIRDLAVVCKMLVRPGGLFVLEHADGQSDEICELLLENNWRRVQVHPDPTGKLRAVSATR